MKISHSLTIFTSACLIGFGASGAVFVNGSFEAPGTPGLGTTYFAVPGAPPAFGWTVASGSIDHLNSYWQPSSGDQSLDLDGNDAGSIYQDFTFGSAGLYAVRFDLSANPDLFSRGDGLGTGLRTVRVDFGISGGPLTALGTYSIDAAPRSIGNMMWVTITTPEFLVSDSATYRLQFTSLSPGIAGNALDNVQLVPEPTTVALFGVGLAGLLLRRRAHSSAPAAR